MCWRSHFDGTRIQDAWDNVLSILIQHVADFRFVFHFLIRRFVMLQKHLLGKCWRQNYENWDIFRAQSTKIMWVFSLHSGFIFMHINISRIRFKKCDFIISCRFFFGECFTPIHASHVWRRLQKSDHFHTTKPGRLWPDFKWPNGAKHFPSEWGVGWPEGASCGVTSIGYKTVVFVNFMTYTIELRTARAVTNSLKAADCESVLHVVVD